MRHLLFGVICLLAVPVQAGTLVSYTFAGLAGSEPDVLPDGSPPNPLASILERGGAIQATGGVNSINSDHWDTGDGFYTFTVTPGSGQTLNLGSLEYTDRRSEFGPDGFSVRFSLDKFVTSTAIGGYTLTDTDNHRETFDLSGFASLANLTSAVEFRILGLGATLAVGTYRLGTNGSSALPANLVITTPAAAVPEPGSIMLLGLGLVGIGVCVSRR